MDRVRDMAAGISAHPASSSAVSKMSFGGPCPANQALTSKRESGDDKLNHDAKRQCLEPLSGPRRDCATIASCNLETDNAKSKCLFKDDLPVTDVNGNQVTISKHISLVKLYPPVLIRGRKGTDKFDKLSEICSRIKAKSTTCIDAPNYLKSVFLTEVRSVPNRTEFKCISNEVKHKPKWKAYFIILDALCATHVARSKKDAKDGMVVALLNLWTSYNFISLKNTSLEEGKEFGFHQEMVYQGETNSRSNTSPPMPIIDPPKIQNEDHKVIRFDTIMESLPRDMATHPLNCTVTPAPRIPNFVLFEVVEDLARYGYENPVGKLFNSASRSKVPIRFDVEKWVNETGRICHKCTVFISSYNIASGLALGAREAKHLAAHNAVEAIKMTNLTLRKSETDAPAISRSELTNASAKEEVVPETNVGHKLLKMMGWKGEGVGLGKREEGIANPVKASGSGAHSKEGLGFDIYQLQDPNTHRLDMHKAYNFLHDYVRSNQEDELVFTSELNLEERKKLHGMCHKLGLRSKSKGKGKDRFLVISRKRDINDLVQAVSEKGGSMGTYELVGPSL